MIARKLEAGAVCGRFRAVRCAWCEELTWDTAFIRGLAACKHCFLEACGITRIDTRRSDAG